ncbi:diphosphomevalonate decarboxylase [Mycetocola reblochoni]|uniref:diphosphomevalonate decarboxylase n=2 Tax=Mycetocola reblochoni TaxID=331618 RepID=A0A1R4IWK8_9MICO|nr:diphosphomevalonate decarboxylase [Mycetocola reblochoni]RLP70952.1 diphosphomevalonate decarboxylase [Mycetocola reblochoni]SJN24250.1 Diphosphomevalonate decarboxylase [Mycetocola reblochoni REB411]
MSRTGRGAVATAHSNIALIKYWGKRDARLAIPSTSSLSLTLDVFPTTTRVAFDDALETDTVQLDGAPMPPRAAARVSDFLDLVRERAGITTAARVVTENAVPTGAGLASSASGFAALAGAASTAAGLDLDTRELSRLARRGSGSASRSVFGGLVQWNAGTGDADSYAEPVPSGDLSLAMIVVVVNAAEKAVSSRDGMRRTVETSPFYEPWVSRSADDLAQMRRAIADADLASVCEIAESNAMGMHGTMLGARPPFSYWEPASLAVMGVVRALRDRGVVCGFTMDAGPNVKIICSPSDVATVTAALDDAVPGAERIVAGPGPGLLIREDAS